MKMEAMLVFCSGNVNKGCFVDNSEVTGEVNLNKKECVREAQSLIDSLDTNQAAMFLNTIDFLITVNDPDTDFNEFKGKLKIKNSPKSSNLTIENFLIRGSKIVAAP